MNIILIFSTEPEEPDGRINRVKHHVLNSLASGFTTSLNVYFQNSKFDFYKNSHPDSREKMIGCVTFNFIKHYNQIKGFLNTKLIKAIVLINSERNVKLPDTILFDCHFPISDIPISDLEKFRIISIS